MNCNDTQILVAYLDGEVTPGEREAIDAHLSICSWCREEVAALTITQKRFRQALQHIAAPPPPGAWLTMRRRIETRRRPWFSIPRLKALLGSPAPAWKAAVCGALVVVLIAGLAILAVTPALPVPPLVEGLGPAKALAQEIALKCPEVQAALGGEEGTVVYVSIRNGTGIVFLGAKGVNHFVAANVHLKERGLIDIQVIPLEGRLSWSELTKEEKEWVIGIAKGDPRVQELLARGAVIEHVAPRPTIARGIAIDWLGREIRQTPRVTIDRASVNMRLGDTMWFIGVNVEKEEVEYLSEFPQFPTIVDERAPVRLTEEQKMRAIKIARGHPLVQEFLDGAIIVAPGRPLAVRYENGERILYLPYGLENAVVCILYHDELTTIRREVLVSLVEERVVRIVEREVGFCRDTKTPISKERVIYP